MAAKPLTQEELLELKELEELEALEAAERSGSLRAPHSVAKTAKEHLVEGAALGHGDTLAGLINSGMSAVMGENSPYAVDKRLRGQGFTGDLDEKGAYQDAVDDRRQLLAETAEDNPKTAMAADLAGGVASTAIATAATGGTNLLAEGAIMGTGYGDSDSLEGNLMNAAGGALLGKYGGKVAGKVVAPIGKALKGAKGLLPERAGMIYNALKTKTGARRPESVKKAIAQLEEKFGLFTKEAGATITPEGASKTLGNIYSNVNSKLSMLTDKMAANVRPDKLKGQFRPLVKKLEEMQSKAGTISNSAGLSKRLQNSINDLNSALKSGDYKQVINLMNNDIKENFVRYTADGEAKVSKEIRGQMKQLLSDFDTKNGNLISSVLGEDSGRLFKESMSDLSAYYKVDDLVKKNLEKGMPDLKPNMQEIIASSFIGYVANPIIGASYMGGSMLLRQPKVQGFMAKQFKQTPRSIQGIKTLLDSPISPLLKENLPPEVGHLVQKMSAGINIPSVQQQLVVKSLTSQFPEFFEHSRYDSLVGNQITDPYEVETEKTRISSDPSLSNVEKYKRISALNKDGTLLSNPETAKGTVAPIAPEEQAQIGSFLDMGSKVINGQD